jgi:hypothetical protein
MICCFEFSTFLPQELGHVEGWKLFIVLTIILMMLNIGAKGVISLGKMIEFLKFVTLIQKAIINITL